MIMEQTPVASGTADTSDGLESYSENPWPEQEPLPPPLPMRARPKCLGWVRMKRPLCQTSGWFWGGSTETVRVLPSVRLSATCPHSRTCLHDDDTNPARTGQNCIQISRVTLLFIIAPVADDRVVALRRASVPRAADVTSTVQVRWRLRLQTREAVFAHKPADLFPAADPR